jgi:hypothetical protein
MNQNWSCSKCCLEILKSFLYFGSPFQLVFTYLLSERGCYLRIILDEDPIEVCKSKETYCLGSRPIRDRLNLLVLEEKLE